MGERWRQIGEAVGQASGALAVVCYARGAKGWAAESWVAPALRELLPSTWLAPTFEGREDLVERILAERILAAGLEDGLGPLDLAPREQLRARVRAAVFLSVGAREPYILWLALPAPAERERLEGLSKLLAGLAAEQCCPFQRLFEHVPAIFLAVDAAGNVQRCNAYLQRLGYQPDELINRPVSELFAPGEWERLQLRLRQQEGQRFKALVRARSGELLAMEFLTLPLEQQGEAPELLTLGCDLREERQIGHYRRLEAVDRLVSGVAHELNNPLQTVVGNAEMLAGMKLPESAHRRAQRALAGARRCQEVVDGLLKLKRTRHGFSDKVSVEEVLRTALKEIETEFAALNVSWRVQVAGEVPTVRGNPADLEQALEHVLRNAAQAVAQQHRPEVRITIETLGEAVQVAVQDNGSGMRPEVMERAFEPFFSTRGIGAGKGLGLSIALGIVQEHGGFIELQSTSAGTLVQFTLPIEGYRPY